MTTDIPKLPISKYKRTKIISTIGPASASLEAIRNLIDSGVNGIRCNFSHGTQEEHAQFLKWARAASKELGKPVAVIQDLQGPKIRLGDFDSTIDVKTGANLNFAYNSDYEKTGHIPTQYDLARKVKAGERIYLFDGRVRAKVTAVREGVVYTKAENNGYLIKRKGINLPDTDFGGDILTKKDLDDVHFGSSQDFDYVALSFVQRASDVENLRKILQKHGSTAKIIVKIETNAAVDNIEEIVKATDMIMIARGDLAVEAPAESVPVVQRRIIGLGQQYGKPTIVATQMLLSMVDNPEPTRAEVSDVATAVFLGADCVMLSEETAMGTHPVEVIKTMKRIVRYAEGHPPLKTVYPFERERSIHNALSSGAISLAKNIDAKAIIIETKSGASALKIASHRPDMPIIAVSDVPRTTQQLTLVHGIKSYLRPADGLAAQKLADWLRDNDVFKAGETIVLLSGRNPGKSGTTDTIKVRVLE